MNLPQWLQYAIAVSLSMAGLAALAGVAWAQFTKGSRQERTEVVSSADKLTQFWKEQADGYKEMMERKELASTERINKLSKELGELTGKFSEKEKQYQDVLLILKDKNPETQKFMDTMLAIAEQAQAFMKNEASNSLEVARILGEIHTMTVEEKNKNLKVVTTVQKVETDPGAAPARRTEDINPGQ